jgi:AcrR family transcriptional regulator
VPRIRSSDYDLKASSILDSAAELFARVGYPAAKLQDIAKACGATKSMLYHYYPTKDDLLFAMLKAHLSDVLAAVRAASEVSGAPDERIAALVGAYTQKSAETRQRHMVAMNDVKFLPPDMQAPLVALQREVVDVTTAMLRSLRPGLPKRTYTPYAMLLIGMLNWTDFWYTPDGPMKPKELRDRIGRLFLHGYLDDKDA